MKRVLCVCCCLALAVAFACATKTTTPKATDMPDPHAGIFAQECAKCHDLKTVEDAHSAKTKLEMKEILIRMQEKPNSDITEEELDILLKQY